MSNVRRHYEKKHEDFHNVVADERTAQIELKLCTFPLFSHSSRRVWITKVYAGKLDALNQLLINGLMTLTNADRE